MNAPVKIYFSISEVCEQTQLEPHVLRYWESEFAQLRPKKNRAGNRAYRAKDIALINLIKHLLYEEKFTISGAKKQLAELKTSGIADIPQNSSVAEPETAESPSQSIATLKTIKEELSEILRILKE